MKNSIVNYIKEKIFQESLSLVINTITKFFSFFTRDVYYEIEVLLMSNEISLIELKTFANPSLSFEEKRERKPYS